MKRLSDYYPRNGDSFQAKQAKPTLASTSTAVVDSDEHPSPPQPVAGPCTVPVGDNEPPVPTSGPKGILVIGQYVDGPRPNDQVTLSLLDTLWTPPAGFVFPFTERKDAEKVRRKFLGPQHFVGQYGGFAFSATKEGIFCKQCVLFGPASIHGVNLDRLVKSPLQKYSHLTGSGGYLSKRLATNFHADSMMLAMNFRKTMVSDAGSVADQINVASTLAKEKNRRALSRIILAIEYHGRLGLALRGHRDAGIPSLASDSEAGIDYSEGNLRASLQLMMRCGDQTLREHFTTCGKNSTYISPDSQNALINSISSTLKAAITSEVDNARFFSLIADETTAFSHQEQLVVCLRYVCKDISIRERFLCFAKAPDCAFEIDGTTGVPSICHLSIPVWVNSRSVSLSTLLRLTSYAH